MLGTSLVVQPRNATTGQVVYALHAQAEVTAVCGAGRGAVLAAGARWRHADMP